MANLLLIHCVIDALISRNYVIMTCVLSPFNSSNIRLEEAAVKVCGENTPPYIFLVIR